jgi:hypothetical protein
MPVADELVVGSVIAGRPPQPVRSRFRGRATAAGDDQHSTVRRVCLALQADLHLFATNATLRKVVRKDSPRNRKQWIQDGPLQESAAQTANWSTKRNSPKSVAFVAGVIWAPTDTMTDREPFRVAAANWV